MMKSILSTCAAVAVAALTTTAACASEIQDMARDYVLENVHSAISVAAVTAAVKAQNDRHAGLSQADVEGLDQRWRSGDAALIEAALTNDLSLILADVVEANGGVVTELFVMDDKGLNVGQSAETSDYWQGDEAKWRKTYLVGAEAIHVSDVEEDESTQTFQVQVSLPLVDGGVPIGAVTVGVNVTALEEL